MAKAKVISFINMKGGVGKTTLTINVGKKLEEIGNNVLIIDMDPQFNATQSLLLHRTQIKEISGSEVTDEKLLDQEEKSAEYYKKLSDNKETVLQIFGDTNITSANKNPSLIKQIEKNLYLIPGDLNLSKEVSGDTVNKASAILDHLEKYNILNDFQYILIDCPPTWSILTHSSLIASDYYIVPSKVDFYSTIGISLLEDQINAKIMNDGLYKRIGRKLKFLGIIFTLVHKNIVSEQGRKRKIKESFKEINFFGTDFPYMPSVPTKFIMIDEAKTNSTYSELVNSIEKITTEIVENIERSEKV
ncbi:hypothetical protein N492_11190 [Clostridium botulinum B2 267]|uniref:ParA family protein n=1 Tax=Clostridium botulinum TaxID=1491 RepID=UPI0007DE5E88|nr:ParA family protein [Clostridium botulinum]KEI87529.1 hypothetical protein N492_11190 [Clostridium botulinum B2 267]